MKISPKLFIAGIPVLVMLAINAEFLLEFVMPASAIFANEHDRQVHDSLVAVADEDRDYWILQPGYSGIKELNSPSFTGVAEYRVRNEDELGVVVPGSEVSYFFPLSVLGWHIVSNFEHRELGRLSVTYNPASNTPVTFLLDSERSALTAVSGVYRGSLLLSPEKEQIIYSQYTGEALIGDNLDERASLSITPSGLATYADWSVATAGTEQYVLTSNTGFIRNYFDDPYHATNVSPSGFTTSEDNRLGIRDRVFGISLENSQYAILPTALSQLNGMELSNGRIIEEIVEKEGNTVQAVIDSGEVIPLISTEWWNWHTYFPETEIIR